MSKPSKLDVTSMIRFRGDDAGQGDSSETNLIRNAWYRGVRETPPYCRIPQAIFHQAHSIRMTRLLDRSKVLLLVHPDDPSLIYGYLVYQKISGILMIHWLWVRGIWRNMGAADKLLSAAEPNWRTAPLVLTSATRRLEELTRRFSNLNFDPYIGESV